MSRYIESSSLEYSNLSLPKKEILFSQKTPYQDIEIFDTGTSLGKILLLDGIIQIIEAYESSYHEMMVHVPMHVSAKVTNILVLGGGDGGIVRELIRYKNIKKITVCEIDEVVVNASKEFFPNMANSFDDPRVLLVIADGGEFVTEELDNQYDLIISDSTDPISIGQSLYGESFYKHILRILSPDGLMVGFGESPFSTPELYRDISGSYRRVFPYSQTYLTYVPMYDSGCWSFIINSKSNIGIEFNAHTDIDYQQLHYFNEDAFRGAFLLPKFVRELNE